MGHRDAMRVMEDLLEVDWEGPLSAVSDVPAAVLYGVVLTFSVAKGPAILKALRSALEPLLGTPEERKSLLSGARLSWNGRVPAEAAVKGGTATVRFGARVKGKRVAEVIDHLATVPEARDLKLRAAVRRFGRGKDEVPLDG